MSLLSRRNKRRIRGATWATVRWVCLWLLLWVAQIVWLYHRLGRPTWSEYWHMRGLYRPGIAAVETTGGEHLPGYVFNPLSPTGAKWAFVISAGVYALAGTMAIWLLWRASQKPSMTTATMAKPYQV